MRGPRHSGILATVKNHPHDVVERIFQSGYFGRCCRTRQLIMTPDEPWLFLRPMSVRCVALCPALSRRAKIRAQDRFIEPFLVSVRHRGKKISTTTSRHMCAWSSSSYTLLLLHSCNLPPFLFLCLFFSSPVSSSRWFFLCLLSATSTRIAILMSLPLSLSLFLSLFLSAGNVTMEERERLVGKDLFCRDSSGVCARGRKCSCSHGSSRPQKPPFPPAMTAIFFRRSNENAPICRSFLTWWFSRAESDLRGD